jgi:hypothetical protein
MKQQCRNQFDELLAFLRRLEEAKIAYNLRCSRNDALMVRINVPGERWEVEFLQDGEVDVERFVSDGDIQEASALDDLFARFSDKDQPVPENANAGK